MCMDVSVYVPGEQTSIYHLLRAQSRQQMQAKTEIIDIRNVLATTHNGIFEWVSSSSVSN